MLNESMEQYNKAVEVDATNEYALSNIGVIHIKRQDFEECEKRTNQVLKIVE